MNKTERIEIRVTPKFKKEFQEKCKRLGVPMSTYLLMQLEEPDWVSKIKFREGRPPSKSIWHPSPPPPKVRARRKEEGIIETLNKTNILRELKQIIFNGVDEFFRPHEENYHADISDRGMNVLQIAHNNRVKKEKLLKEAPKRKLPIIPGGKTE